MNGWQDIAALALVALATGFVAWRAWLAIAVRRVPGCGSGCNKCVTDNPPILQIESDVKR
jgi:hypothetical protein